MLGKRMLERGRKAVPASEGGCGSAELQLSPNPLCLFGVWQLYNGTLKRDVESRRYSSYSQMEGWASRSHGKALCSPRAGSDYCFVQNIKSSRSEPDLYCEPPRGTLRKAHGGSRAEHKTTLNRQSIYSSCSTQQGTSRTSKKMPARALSCPSSNKPDVVYAQPMMSCKQDGVYGQAQSSSK